MCILSLAYTGGGGGSNFGVTCLSCGILWSNNLENDSTGISHLWLSDLLPEIGKTFYSEQQGVKDICR